MAPMFLSGEAMKPSMPAWKRLGLKLKSAQQESAPYAPPVVITPVATHSKTEKRKLEINDQKIPPGKRVRVNIPPKIHEPKADTTQNQSPITSAQKRRKSVTFTPETKIEDGDSVKELYNGWIAKYPLQNPNFHDLDSRSPPKSLEPAKPAEQVDFAIDEILQEVETANRPHKGKNPKKVKLRKSQQVSKSSKQLDPALSYLQLFHSSKNTWKFNKIHQITLLKNAFNVEKIPSQYIEIFYTYVSGLKGSARTHLRDAAIAIKIKAQEESAKEFGENMGSVAATKETEDLLEEDFDIKAPDLASKIGYEERVLQPLSDLTIKQRIAKRMRAERILDELAQEAQEPGKKENGSPGSNKDLEEDRESQKRLKMSDGSTQKIRRKRKQRTNAINDSSSSESTDSDSSENEEDEETPDPAEDESSSSSSSSSSNSEDEEDSQGSESGSGSDESD